MATNEYTDINGVLRRPGSLVLPPGFVSSLPPYAGEPEQPLWDDNTIQMVLDDPDRRNMIDLFPFEEYGTDQHSSSGCNGHMEAAMFTAARKLRGIDDGFVASGAFTYSFINGGRDNGSMLDDGMMSGMENGHVSVDLVPWNMIYAKQRPAGAIAEGKKHLSAKSFRAVTRQGWNSGLAAGYVGGAAIQVGPKFDKISDGVAGVQAGPGNHAVLIEDIRWRNGRYEYLMRNSWGIKYGNKGRVWLVWEHFKQTFANHIFYLTPTTSEAQRWTDRSSLPASWTTSACAPSGVSCC